MKEKETIRVHDSKDFHYEVDVDHSPQFGFSTAYYRGSIIAQVDAYKIYKPSGDDDREWEEYEEAFAIWRDDILSHLKPRCKNYFDRN